jgi:Immunity protein Imm1
MKVTFNGTDLSFASFEEFASALGRFDLEPQFELWLSRHDGPSLAMLRNGDHAWLMYLRFRGDSGVVSRGDRQRQGTCSYALSNGQTDEYPLSWCVTLEQCYKALAYFFVNNGARCDFVTWQEA